MPKRYVVVRVMDPDRTEVVEDKMGATTMWAPSVMYFHSIPRRAWRRSPSWIANLQVAEQFATRAAAEEMADFCKKTTQKPVSISVGVVNVPPVTFIKHVQPGDRK